MQRPLFSVWVGLIILTALRLWGGGDTSPWLPDGGTLAEGSEIVVTGQVCWREDASFYLNEITFYSEQFIDDIKAANQQRISKTYKLKCETTAPTAIGEYVAVRGVFFEFSEATNPGEFDSRTYYRSKQVMGRLKNAELIERAEPAFGIREWLLQRREYWEAYLTECFPKKEAAIMSALLLGEKGGLEEETRELYRRNGILHILSISSLHITILGMGLYRLLRKAGLPVWAAAVLGGMFMIGYGMLTGFGVSVCRAVGMYLLRMLAEVAGRTYDMLNALGAVGGVMLLWNPYYLQNSGFLLSYTCVLGIGIVYPVLKKWLEERQAERRKGKAGSVREVRIEGRKERSVEEMRGEREGKERSVREVRGEKRKGKEGSVRKVDEGGRKKKEGSVRKVDEGERKGKERSVRKVDEEGRKKKAGSVRKVDEEGRKKKEGSVRERCRRRKEKEGNIGKVCGKKAKVMLIDSLLLSISIQLVTLPVQLWFFFEVPVLGGVINLLILPLVKPLVISGVFLLLFPFAGKWISVVGIFILRWYELVCSFFDRLPWQTWNPGRPEIWQILVYYGALLLMLRGMNRGKNSGRGARWGSGCLFVIGLILLGMRFGNGAQIIFLDVGQGDCVLIQTEAGENYLYDCGSTSRSNVGKYVLLPYLKYRGIRNLDAIFVSHPDRDHVNGVIEVLEYAKEKGIQVAQIVISATGIENAAEQYEELLEAAAGAYDGAGAEVRLLAAGDKWSGRKGAAEFLCLHPGAAGEGELDANEASLCLYARLFSKKGELSVLLTGDVEGPGEELLTESLERYGIEKTDVWKVAHHGSRNATGEAFLKQIKGEWQTPLIAVISCGRKNRYGHPHEETIDRIEAAGAEWYCTKENGAVTVTTDKGGKIKVKSYGR